MRRVVEPLAFLCLASAVHAGVWLSVGSGAAPGAGSGGDAALSLEAAGADMAAMVERWDQAPDRAAAPVAMTAPAARDMALTPGPAAPAPEARAAVAPVPRLAPSPAAETAPTPEVAATAPRPDPVRRRPRGAPESAPRDGASADPAPAQPAQRAAGTGQRQTAGQGGASTAAQPSPGQLRALEAEWGSAILARIARAQRYPSGDHGSGTARVTLSIGRDGSLQSAGVSESSGIAALDRAALDAVRRAGRFPAAPRGLANPAYVFRVPMTFRRN